MLFKRTSGSEKRNNSITLYRCQVYYYLYYLKIQGTSTRIVLVVLERALANLNRIELESRVANHLLESPVLE